MAGGGQPGRGEQQQNLPHQRAGPGQVGQGRPCCGTPGCAGRPGVPLWDRKWAPVRRSQGPRGCVGPGQLGGRVGCPAKGQASCGPHGHQQHPRKRSSAPPNTSVERGTSSVRSRGAVGVGDRPRVPHQGPPRALRSQPGAASAAAPRPGPAAPSGASQLLGFCLLRSLPPTLLPSPAPEQQGRALLCRFKLKSLFCGIVSHWRK